MVTDIFDDGPAQHRADLGRRAAARAVDLLTVGAWLWAMSVAGIALHLKIWSDDVTPSPWGRLFLFVVTFAVLHTLYEVAFTSRTGATPGKDLMRLKVLDDATGGRPSAGQALRRSLPMGLVWLVPPTWIAVPLTAALGATGLSDTDGRTLHDRLAATRVVHQPELERRPGQTPEEAAAERRRQFVPRFVDPIHILPRQILRHPGAGGDDRDRQDRED